MSHYTRYFTRGYILAFLAIAFVVAAIVMVNFFDLLLERIARGNLDRSYLLPMLGAGFVRYFAFALGSAACLSGVYTLLQMHQKNEMVAWYASGQSQLGILAIIMRIGLGFAIFSAACYLWINPANERFYAKQYDLARQSAEARLLNAGAFTPLPDLGQMYVETFNTQNSAFTNSFLVILGPGPMQRLTTAASGSLSSMPHELRFGKESGQVVSVVKGKVVEKLDFETLQVVRPRVAESTSSREKVQQRDTSTLLTNLDDKESAKELGKRFATIGFVFNNALLAGLLLFSKPRRSQMPQIFFIIVLHLIYQYTNEWQLSMADKISLPPLIWLQLPNLIFLVAFTLLWLHRMRRW